MREYSRLLILSSIASLILFRLSYYGSIWSFDVEVVLLSGLFCS
jgi:hypothetical protein